MGHAGFFALILMTTRITTIIIATAAAKIAGVVQSEASGFGSSTDAVGFWVDGVVGVGDGEGDGWVNGVFVGATVEVGVVVVKGGLVGVGVGGAGVGVG
jgi:hypothetical protein